MQSLKMSLVAVVGVALTVSGCSTVSFAPPKVVVAESIKARTVDNAIKLTDTFLTKYRDAGRELANGRQWFEVPAILALAGGATAAAFGAGGDVAIATGAAAALFGSGKAYYAPEQKLPLLQAAVDALICIKTESVGVAAYEYRVGSGQKNEVIESLKTSNSSTVGIGVEQQYYELVSASVFSVESILAQRLPSVGSYAPDALVSEITAIVEKQMKAAEEQEEQVAVKVREIESGAQKSNQRFDARSVQRAAEVLVELSTLQPALQKCVVRAKL